MITKFTIYGERCSGTNYLEKLIKLNFKNCSLTWKYGWKHFFGFQEEELKNSKNTLFICIIRDPVDWANSFYREMWHLPLKYKKNLMETERMNEFLYDDFWSFYDHGKNLDVSKEIMEDRHIYTKKRYKNILELRYTKLKFMMEDLPKKVDHTIFIRYEDLIHDFQNTMIRIKNKGLTVKTENEFPKNYLLSNTKKLYKKKKNNRVLSEKFLHHPSFNIELEHKLGYNFF
jgi:hypothetical protein